MMMIPAQIRQCRLFQRQAHTVESNLFSREALQALKMEAIAGLRGSTESLVPRSDAELWRGGNPARRFLSVPGGEIQEQLYQHPDMLQRLERIVGLPVKPSGQRGTFTYYARAGDYIGIHRDVEICDLAVITCLSDGPKRLGHSGAFVCYPDRIEESNPALRKSPSSGAKVKRLEPGETVVLLGGVLPHAVLPVVDGQVRVVSVLCYSLPK